MKPSFLARVKQFFRENPSAVFVLGFQVLLAACAVLLIFGLSLLAEGLAVVAYFSLLAGVLLLLIHFVKDSRGTEVGK